MSVGGLVEHEHGIVDLRGDKQHSFLLRALSLSLSHHAAYCLTSALLKFCREAQQQMDRKREEGRGEAEGGLQTSDRLQRGGRGGKNRKIC